MNKCAIAIDIDIEDYKVIALDYLNYEMYCSAKKR